MAQTIFEVSAGTDTMASPRVAAREGGGAFVLVDTTGPFGPPPGTAVLYRIDAVGVVVWSTTIEIPSDYQNGMALVARGSVVAVVIAHAGALKSTVALLNQSDGTQVWQKELPIFYDDYQISPQTSGIAITSTGDVYVVGRGSTGTTVDQYLTKLAAADGALIFYSGVWRSGAAANNRPLQVAVFSNNDACVTLQDDASPKNSVLRLASADGSLVWTTRIAFSANANSLVWTCVDASNNVYVSCGTGPEFMSILKFDSTGTQLWSKDITAAETGSTLTATGGIAADASNVYAGVWYANAAFDYQRAGLVVINAAGTAATMALGVPDTNVFTNGAESVSVADGSAYFTGNREAAGVLLSGVHEYDPAAGGAITYDSIYTRVIESVTVNTGTATVTQPSITLATPTSIAESAGTLTYSAEALTETVYTGTPSGGGSEDQFGVVNPWPRSTTFGTPRYGNAYLAQGFRSTAFGTPALDYNLEPEAHSLGPTARFGTPYAIVRDPTARAFYASGFRSTAYGSATAAIAGQYAQLSADPSTRFGTPRARIRQAATSVAPTAAFGTAGAVIRARAVGFRNTLFGTPTVNRIAYASGFLSGGVGTPRAPGAASGRYFDAFSVEPSTRFGTPRARLRQAASSIAPTTTFGTIKANTALGFKTTNFGTPTVLLSRQASGFVSGGFGTPRAPGAQYGRYFDAYSVEPSTRFGTPRVRLRQQATSIAPTTVFGTPAPTQATGFKSTMFGTPSARLTFIAQGFRSGAFGTPRAPGAQYGRYFDAFSFGPTTTFGTPRARIRQSATSIAPTTTFGNPATMVAQGFRSTVFGTPSVRLTFQAHGFLSGGFGTPRAPGAQFGRYFDSYSLGPTAVFGAPRLRTRHQATSIAPTTTFGAPSITIATGFLATRFGTPTAVRIGAAQGFITGGFGTPRAPGAQYGRYFDAYSLGPTVRFGTPTARMRLAASSIAPTTTFGTPGGAGATGFRSTAFGLPTAVMIGRAAGFLSGGMGTPRAPGAQYGRYFDAYSLGPTTRFGTPRARQLLAATSIGAVTNFGTPVLGELARAVGFRSTSFGLATAVQVQRASGFLSGTFGTPRAPRPDAGLPFGFSTTVFGAPRARWVTRPVAAGFSSTAFGTPTMVQGNRVRAIGPTTRFGTPYVARTCPP